VISHPREHSRRFGRHWLGLLMGLGASCSSQAARAESIADRRSDAYYAAHVGGSATLTIGTLLVERVLLPNHGPGLDWQWFPGDLAIRGRFSESASAQSDVTLWMSAFGPVFAHTGLGTDDSLANAMTAYLEAFAAQYTLNVVVKHAVARPRPYTHHENGTVVEFRRRQQKRSSEAFLSFYSGHAGLSFTSATSGSYLYGVRSDDAWARRAVWSAEMALAGATASLRLVAGRHYVSDVLAGAVIGTTIGIGVPLLHGYEPHDDLGEDLVWAAGGLTVGATLPWLLGSAGYALVPLESGAIEWSLSASVEGAPGLAVHGIF
jgi:membrane-associated phospholipid phosphatase